MDKARFNQFGAGSGKEKAWVLLVKERRQWDVIIILIISIFVKCHKVVTSEAG